MDRRVGIEGKLSLALGSLAALTAAAFLVSWLAFTHIRSSVADIIEGSVPESTLALKIAETSAHISSRGPVMAASRTHRERTSTHSELVSDFLELSTYADEWERLGITSDSTSDISRHAANVTLYIGALNEATEARLDVAARLAEETNRVLEVHNQFLEQLEPLIDDEVFKLVIDADARAGNALAASSGYRNGSAELVDAMLTLKSEGNLAVGILIEISSIRDLALLPPLVERLEAAAGQMERAFRRIPENTRFQALRQTTLAMLQLGRVRDNVAELRRSELEHVSAANIVLEQTRATSSRLEHLAIFIVAEAEIKSTETARGARSAIRGGQIILLLIALASWGGVFAVLRWYVRPQISRPIRDITEAMEYLSEGDTGVTIPGQDRDDELGRMAKALGVFRDITVQVQESNLREIESSRSRLTDAIESISEAFSLYDREDRLVVCNSKYRSLLSAHVDGDVVPGMTFTEILNLALTAGLVEDAVGREDEWLAERLKARSEGTGSGIIRYSTGSWIMVSERRTSEGGVVAVYSDITDLKEREAELAEKSAALERLSHQLSKYLSPQIYESIFSGRQTAIVAGRRKRLTVFFSDIAGFTETADRLESEDLTKLVNDYLTEMTTIALKHGATIDKYIGDAIMAFFGDPVSNGEAEDALSCVLMAIEMRKKLQDLVDSWREHGIVEHLETRTGIHTGFCTVGNFGSDERMDYTIMGGAVNLAARLERAAEPGTILISNETYRLVRKRVHCEEAEPIKVKGIAYPVRPYVAVDTHENVAARNGKIIETTDNLSLEVDLGSMTEAERVEAARKLKEVLDRLG